MNHPKPAKLIPGALFCAGMLVFTAPGAYGYGDTDTSGNPILGKSITFYLGGFYPRVSSTIRLDADIFGDTDIGDTISLEDELGLEQGETVLWGGMAWRMSKRNSLEIEYFQLNRSGSEAAVTNPFQLGNSLVKAGAQVDTVFDVDIGRVTYGYSFIKKERWDLDVKGGLHWLRLDAEITLSGEIVDITTDKVIEAGSSVTEGGAIGAPLPHIGFSFNYAITPKLLARAQALLFDVSIEQYSGYLSDVGFDFAYTPIKHFGFGGGLRYFDLRLEADETRLSGEFNYRYWGPSIYLIGTF